MNNAGPMIIIVLIKLVNVYSWIIIADALLSWFLPAQNIIRRITIFFTEPLVAVFRPLSMKLLRRSMLPISLANVFAYLFLVILRQLLTMIYVWLYL